MRAFGVVLCVIYALNAADSAGFDPYHCSWYPKGGAAGIEEPWSASFRPGDTVRVRLWVQNLCGHNHYLFVTFDKGKTYSGVHNIGPISCDTSTWEPCERGNCSPFGDVRDCGISGTPPCFSIYPYGWYRWVEWVPSTMTDSTRTARLLVACFGCKHEKAEQDFAFVINYRPRASAKAGLPGVGPTRESREAEVFYSVLGRRIVNASAPFPVLSEQYKLVTPLTKEMR